MSPDGAVSDGMVETYMHRISAPCGRPEAFFASVFSAQGQRCKLGGYRTAEAKELLADLLGQDELQRWGQRADETMRLLKSALSLLRRQRADEDREALRLDEQRQRMAKALRNAQQRHAAFLQDYRRAEGSRTETRRACVVEGAALKARMQSLADTREILASAEQVEGRSRQRA